MHLLERQHDIQPLSRADMTIHLNGQPVAAAAGETVLNVLNAVGLRRLARNDHGQASGAFCGMGVCHCCLVAIDGRPKRRACQTVVRYRACGWKPKATASTGRNGHEPAPGDRRRRLGRHGRSHRAGQARGPLHPLRRGLASRRGGLSRPLAGRRRSGLPRRALHPDAGKTAARFLRLRRAHRPAPEQPRGRRRRPAPDGPRRGGTAARGGVFAPAPGHRLP